MPLNRFSGLVHAGSPVGALYPGKRTTDLCCHPDMNHWGSCAEFSRSTDAVNNKPNDLQAVPAEILVIVPSGKGPCDLRDIRHRIAMVEHVHRRSKNP